MKIKGFINGLGYGCGALNVRIMGRPVDRRGDRDWDDDESTFTVARTKQSLRSYRLGRKVTITIDLDEE